MTGSRSRATDPPTNILVRKAFGYPGDRYYIDVDRVTYSGGRVISNGDLRTMMQQAVENGQYPQGRVDKWLRNQPGEQEALITATDIAPISIDTGASLTLKRAGRGFLYVGLALSARDLIRASQESKERGSLLPMKKEVIRQVGGWTGAIVGGKIGCFVGGLAGIETGPGAFVTCAAGGLIGGVTGFYGADWVAEGLHDDD